MTNYTTILFYNTPDVAHTFKSNDGALLAALVEATGKNDLELKRETYKDGSWSWWYSLTSPASDSGSLKDVALAMKKYPV